jgi:hypothetical protein
MMASKNGVGQIIKALVTVVTLVALTGGFCVIKATLDDLCRLTRGIRNAVGPAQLADGPITLHIIDEMLDVDLHGWTPVRDRGMRCHQYIRSSNSTPPESNKSVLEEALIPDERGGSAVIFDPEVVEKGWEHVRNQGRCGRGHTLVCVIIGMMCIGVVVHVGIVDGEQPCAKWEDRAAGGNGCTQRIPFDRCARLGILRSSAHRGWHGTGR